MWSGGSAADGDYPLLSEAIEQGLYHPRCRDSHTTYFPELEEEAPLTKAEERRQEAEYESQQKEANARRQGEKYDRLAQYSLDSENRRKYRTKAQAWGKETVANNKESDIITPRKELNSYLGAPIIKTDNQSVREWYVANVSDIPNQVDKSKPLEEQARQAFELRNRYKHEARVAMSDLEAAQKLEELRPAPTFDALIISKMQRKGLTHEEALKDILETASKTNADVNKEFGL